MICIMKMIRKTNSVPSNNCIFTNLQVLKRHGCLNGKVSVKSKISHVLERRGD